MPKQDASLQLAILKRRVRLEEINGILDREKPKGGLLQGLIDERLLLEEVVAELKAERDRLQLQNIDSSFRWEDLDQRILSHKTSEIAEEMHKRAADAQRRISHETAQSGSSAGYLPRWIDFHEQLTNEWAEKVYTAHCEAWMAQNRTISPAFIRAVRDQAIAQTLAARKSSVQFEIELRALRIGDCGNPQNSSIIGEWIRRMDRLAVRWNRKLEAEAAAAEYRSARPSRISTLDLTRPPRGVSEDPPPVSSRGLSPKNLDSSKPGRTRIRPTDFVTFAGRLWLAAKRQPETNANVTVDQLKQVASALDEQRYTPPANYLERKYARELKAFNSKNSNSKIGPIQTWSRLVAIGDKDHVRGMRRLLSRCAERLLI